MGKGRGDVRVVYRIFIIGHNSASLPLESAELLGFSDSNTGHPLVNITSIIRAAKGEVIITAHENSARNQTSYPKLAVDINNKFRDALASAPGLL